MAMSSDGKVVQTELAPAEYERLRQVARQEDKPLKEVLRQAALAYVDTHVAPDPNDPFFTLEPPAGDGEEVSASDADEFLYGDPQE